MADWTLGFVALGRGDIAGAERQLEIALEEGEASGWLEMILPPLWGLAETAVLRGDPFVPSSTSAMPSIDPGRSMSWPCWRRSW